MEELLKKFDLSVDEMNEYRKLNDEVFGRGVFKSHKRLNELSGKVIKLNAYLLADRKNPDVISVIEGWY